MTPSPSSSSSSTTMISSTSSTNGEQSSSTSSTSTSSSKTTSASSGSTSSTMSSTTSPDKGSSSSSTSLTSKSSSTSTSSAGSSTSSSITSSGPSTSTTDLTSSSTRQTTSTTSSPSSTVVSSTSSTQIDDGGSDDGNAEEFAESLVITDDKDVYGVKDGTNELSCVLTSSTEKKIFWYQDDNLLAGAEQKAESAYSEDYGADVYTVTSTISPTSSGVYSCSISGLEGEKPSVQVYILEPFTKDDEIFQRKDKPITMTCFAPRESEVSFFKGEEKMTAEGADDIFKEVDTEKRGEVEWVKYQKVIDFARLDQDGVVYTCKAHFGEDEVVHHSFTLEITDTVTLTTIPHKDTFYAIDTKVTITCNANTKVIGEIKWYTKEGETEKEVVEEAGVLEIEIGENEATGNSYAELIFVSAKKDDSKTYLCEVEEIKSSEIAIAFYPVVTKSEPVSALEGQPVTMTCSAPEGAAVTFYMGEEKLTDDGEEETFTKTKEEMSSIGYNMFVYEKVFPQVKLSQNDEKYYCMANMGDLKVLDHTFTLQIGQIASLAIAKAEKYYKAGTKVALVCTANKKLEEITWWREASEGDVQIEEVSNSIVITEAENSAGVTISTLEYLSAKVEHSGVYYCKGEEQKSTNTMEIMVFVTKEATNSLTVNDGIPFTISCWSYKENFEFFNGEVAFNAYTLEEGGQKDGDWEEKILKLRLDKDQGGKFECVSMFDTFKVSSYVYNIDVQPLGTSIITPSEGYPMKPEGVDLTLTCKLVVIAEVKLIWLIGEKEIDDSQFTNEYLKESNTQQSVLTLDDVEIADTGSYSCLTVNRGSASSVSVNIFDPVEFTFEETKFQLVGTAVEFVCYSVSTGTMTAQWAGKERALTEEDYEKTESATINGFTMDRYDISFTIKSIEDAGGYGCKSTAYDTTVYSLTGTLDVYTKPEIKIDGQTEKGYTTIQGADFTVNGKFTSSKDVSANTKMVLVLKRQGETDLERNLPTPTYSDNTISSSLAVENVPVSYTGQYVIQVTADNMKVESDPLPLFVIAPKISAYDDSLAVGDTLEIVCYTMEGNDIKYLIDDVEQDDADLTLEAGADFRTDGGIIFKTKVWKTVVKDDSAGVYKCQGFLGDDMVAETTVTFDVLVFSDATYYQAEEIGDEVKLLCYQVVQNGVYMKYFYNGVQDDSVSPEIGKTFEEGGKQYTEYFWVLGKMTEAKQGTYKCESYVLQETRPTDTKLTDGQEGETDGLKPQKVVSVTTELAWYSLTVPEGAITRTSSAAVECAYTGPAVEGITWTLDDKVVTGDTADINIANTGTSTERTDTLTVGGLSSATTLKIAECAYQITGNFNKKVAKEILVSRAELTTFEEVTVYTTEDVTLTCKYTGADRPTVTWYNMKDPENPIPITSTDINSEVYIVSKEEGNSRSVELNMVDLGYRPVPLACDIKLVHSERSNLVFVDRQQTTLKRTGFSKKLPKGIMRLEGELTLECAWGSSDTPSSVRWRIDGEAPLIDFSRTRIEGYLMISTLDVSVSPNSDETWTCIFEDENKRTAQSSAQVYGAVLTIDRGAEFYPTLDENAAKCTLETAASVDKLEWIKNAEAVESSESQKVDTVTANEEITLTSLKLDPELDGTYSCQATAYGETISQNMILAHTGVSISAPDNIIIRTSEVITLKCLAASRARIGKVRWSINGNRVPSLKYVNSDYLDFKMTSTLETNPVDDALAYGSKILDYECVAATTAGLFTDDVELNVHSLQLTPSNVVALDQTWSLTCTVVSNIKPTAVIMKKGDVELKKWTDFVLKNSQVVGDVGGDVAVKPGEEGFEVSAGTFSYRQAPDSNEFIMEVENSNYKDAGTYTCNLVYADDSVSQGTSEVNVRTVLSSQPEVLYTPLETLVLTCYLYHDTEVPDFAKWYYKGNNIGNSLSPDNPYKSTYTVENPKMGDAGDYKCEYGFSDGNNPSYTINLQFAEIKITSEKTITLQRGSELEIEATVYSSNEKGAKMIWYFNGEPVEISKGFTPKSKKSGNGYTLALTNPSVDATLAGEYHVEFTNEAHSVKLVSEKVTVVVVGSAKQTNYVNNFGGAITLECQYQGAVAPTSVSWTYKDQPVDGKWTKNDGTFENNVQTSTISASAMDVTESGEYDCTFLVNSVSITTTNVVTVRTISISKTGTQYITTDSWDVSIVVSSVQPPKNIFITRGEARITEKMELNKVGDVRTYTFSLSYDLDNRAGKDDGTYVFEAVYDDGVTLKTDPLKIIARLAVTEEEEVRRVLISSIQTENIIRTCEYSGVDTPDEVQWWIGDQIITANENYVVKKAQRTVEGKAGNYLIVESAIDIKTPTWQDGGIFKCKFTFSDGENVEVALPKTIVVEGTGLKSCQTFFDGSMELTCNFQTKETVERIEWNRWRNAVDGSKYVTTKFENNKMTSVLTLTDATTADSGRYYCSAVITGESEEYRIQTDIRFAELTIAASPPGPHLAGGKVIITCQKDGRFNDVMILKDGKETGDSQIHRLTVSSETAGKYTCTATAINLCEEVPATAKASSGEEFIEVVSTLPVVITQPQDVSVTESGTQQMSCVVPSIEGANTKITWYKQGEENKIIWPKNNYDSEQNRWESTIRFNKAQFNDVGSYRCKASYGEVTIESDYASLTLVGFKTSPSEKIGVLGSQAKFTCSYSATTNVVLELITDDGDTSNVNMVMEYTAEGTGQLSTGVATFSALTEANRGNYYCRVSGQESGGTDAAELQVLSITVQPQDSWTVTGDTAGFTVQIERFEWEGFTVSWEKFVSGSWEAVNPSNKYRIQSAKAGRWYSFINIPNYDSTLEATRWRAKLTFPNDESSGLIGGTLTSDEAEVRKAGETSVTLEKVDTFEGTAFTLRCTVTAQERPRIMRIMFDSYRKRDWENDATFQFTFENNVATVSVEGIAKYWYSDKKIGCMTYIGGNTVLAETSFYTVTRECPALSRSGGDITISENQDGDGIAIGKTATLTCRQAENFFPYDSPLEVVCLYDTGTWNDVLTTCNKVIPIDFSKIKVGIFFKAAQSYCNTEAKAQTVEAILGAAAGRECGFRNVKFPCIEAGDCTLMDEIPDEPDCKVERNANNDLGITVYATYKLNDDIAVDKDARNDPDSKYSQYKEDGTNILQFYKNRASSFFRCVAGRRRRDLQERYAHGGMSASTEETSPTTTTLTTTTTSATTPSTPTKEDTPKVTDAHSNKMTIPVTANTSANESEERILKEVVTIEQLEVFEVEDVEMEGPPSGSESVAIVPETDAVDEKSAVEEDYLTDEMNTILGGSQWELGAGTLILLVGLLAGVAIVIMFKIALTTRRHLQEKEGYQYSPLCES
ncbi:hypothetical protein ACHWQZ_G004472 [Mnemiopsis leidyi]